MNAIRAWDFTDLFANNMEYLLAAGLDKDSRPDLWRVSFTIQDGLRQGDKSFPKRHYKVDVVAIGIQTHPYYAGRVTDVSFHYVGPPIGIRAECPTNVECDELFTNCIRVLSPSMRNNRWAYQLYVWRKGTTCIIRDVSTCKVLGRADIGGHKNYRQGVFQKPHTALLLAYINAHRACNMNGLEEST